MVLCMIALCTVFFVSIITNSNDMKTEDTVYINKLIAQTEEHWNALSADCYSEIREDFKVITRDGTVVFSTYQTGSMSYAQTLNEAYKNRDIVTDIMQNNQIAGKLIIHNTLTHAMYDLKKKLVCMIFLFTVCISAIIFLYYVYLDRKLFQPFRALEKFASHIAAGNLDVELKMDKDHIFGAFSESFDIMRENLKIAREIEYEADKSKKEMMASLSHDIKTPIASIKAVSEIMALSSEDSHITVIREKANQIERLVDDMMSSTLEELGKLKVTNEEYESSILADMITSVDYFHRIKQIDEVPECLVIFDKLRLTQVFDNVISNSYKYADTDIEVSFVHKYNLLEIYFRDFGTGVAEEDLPLLLDKYYRGENSKGKNGTGLGLYTSHLFLSKMGGEIDCYNDHGFIVKISLTLAGNNDLRFS